MARGPRLEPRIAFEQLHRGEPGRDSDRQTASAERGDDGLDDALDVGREEDWCRCRPSRRSCGGRRQGTNAEAAARDRLDDRHAEPAGQRVRVHPDALPFRFVAHVQADDDGASEFEELERQFETPAQERGIENVDDRIDGRAQEDIPRLDFRLIERGQRVEPRQVDDRHAVPVNERLALEELDGRAGHVRRVRFGAHPVVEDRALAAIGLSDECDAHGEGRLVGVASRARRTQADELEPRLGD